MPKNKAEDMNENVDTNKAGADAGKVDLESLS